MPTIKKPKRKKKSEKQKLRDDCDKLYQELGRKMYKNCFCGKPYSCLHHHVPKSRSSALRYEIKNGVPICAGCHNLHHSASDTDIEFKYKLFMEDKWGKDWEIELRQQRFASDIKTNIAWYKANIEMLEEMIKAYKDEPKLEDNF
jgi:hypothetical protein